jgi:hypothetical protein
MPVRHLQKERTMDTDEYAGLLGRAALEVWGDIPRDIQEALFEIAVRDRGDLRPGLAKLLHERHPRTEHLPKSAASE